MDAEEPAVGGVAEDGEGQAIPGNPGSQDGPGEHEGPGRGGSGEPGAVPRETPQAAQALESPLGGAAAEPAPMARIPRPVPLQFRLTAEDTDQLRLSITSCLQDLLLVIRTMRHILPPFVLVSPNRVNRG
ncbi:hypothetical protein QTO34_000170 [Cnephaeus nilssonii]|uniref:Cancer/testis antigen 1-like n=1 Tax=Cnephaeus nilssonii TaxID=3371016 RepID=A0AA40IBE9_CNENI|nr:hypothetical protein QTO34_000170 [Eptesicus nilssonii]